MDTAALTGSKLLVTASQVVILPIIAIYLSVEDFGAVALAMTVVVFAQLLSDAGIGRSLIRQKTLNKAEWNTVYWFLFLVGLLLMGALILIAPLAARLFDVPITGPLIIGLSIVPFLFALAAVPAARMERDGQFQELAVIQLIAAVLGLAIAIWFAVEGAGAWALVAQQIVIALVRLLLVMVVSNYTYGWPAFFVGIRKHILFGRDAVGVAFVFTGQRQMPVLLIGYFLGQTSLGLFSMSQRFLNLPHMALTGPFSQTAYLRMTQLQDEKGKMAEVFIVTMRLLAFVVFPPMMILAAVAGDMFVFVFSEEWRLAGVVYALAAFGFAIECVTSTASPMFQAADKSFLRLKMTTERAVLRTVAMIAALPFGIEGVALSFTLFGIAYLVREMSYARDADPFSRREAILSMGPAVIVSLVAAAGLFVINALQGPVSGWVIVAELVVVVFVAWGVLLAVQYKTLRKGLAVLGR